MTETLPYNPAVANQPEFTSDEQNSLEVAEKLGQQESELYAGKVENEEELENAYLELQRKMGSGDTDEDTEEDERRQLRIDLLTIEMGLMNAIKKFDPDYKKNRKES